MGNDFDTMIKKLRKADVPEWLKLDESRCPKCNSGNISFAWFARTECYNCSHQWKTDDDYNITCINCDG